MSQRAGHDRELALSVRTFHSQHLTPASPPSPVTFLGPPRPRPDTSLGETQPDTGTEQVTQLDLSHDWCCTSVFSKGLKEGGHLPMEGKRRGLQGSKCSPWRWEPLQLEDWSRFSRDFPRFSTHMHARVNVHVCAQTRMHVCSSHVCTCIHTCTCAHTYTYPFPNLNLISLRQLRSQRRLQTCLLGRPSLGYPFQTHSCLGFRARGALRWFHKMCRPDSKTAPMAPSQDSVLLTLAHQTFCCWVRKYVQGGT